MASLVCLNTFALQCVLVFFLRLAAAGDGGIPQIKGEMKSRLEAQMGKNIRLPCPVESTPSLIVEWYKDGSHVDQLLDNVRAQRKGLLIINATAENEGNYVCRAVNGFGTAEVSVYLNVRGAHGVDDGSVHLHLPDRGDGEEHLGSKPEFVDPSSYQKNYMKSPLFGSVRFRCTVRGIPKPEIYWIKDGRPLVNGDTDNPPKGPTLWLKNLRMYHKGNYTCVARNVYGSINTTFVLDVVSHSPSKPVLTEGHPLNTTVELGSSASFQCRVHSDDMPHIQWLKKMPEWMKNGTIEFEGERFKVLNSSESHELNGGGLYINKLLLGDVREGDSGTYVCMAANTMGYSFKSAHLTVIPNHNLWHTQDVYDAASVDKFPVTAFIIIPLMVLFMIIFVFIVVHCKQRCAPPKSKSTAGGCKKVSGTVGRSTTSSLVTADHETKQLCVANSHKMAPLLTAKGEPQQWVDAFHHGQCNSMSSWGSQHHYPPNGRRSGSGVATATPSSSVIDSCSGNSGGVGGSLPKVHHHHHHYRHHQHHVHYGQDDWPGPF